MCCAARLLFSLQTARPRAVRGAGARSCRPSGPHATLIQLRLTPVRWLLRYMSGATQLWTYFWRSNVRRVQDAIPTTVPLVLVPMYLWPKSKKVFPLVTSVYAAWHASSFQYASHYLSDILSLPMLNNNYIKWNDYFIPSTDQLDVIIAQLPPAEQSIQIRQLVCERIPVKKTGPTKPPVQTFI